MREKPTNATIINSVYQLCGSSYMFRQNIAILRERS
jgi:hypothetical protein